MINEDEETIISQYFISDRNSLLVYTNQRILVLNLKEKADVPEEKQNIKVKKIGDKEKLLCFGESEILFQKMVLDMKNMYYFVESEGLQLKLDVFDENDMFDLKRFNDRTILAFKDNDKTVKLIDSLTSSVQIETDAIQSLKLNDQMNQMATICSNGQNIKIWNFKDVKQIQKEPDMKFYRGKNPSKITSMDFSNDGSYLAVATEKGTIHLFNVRDYNKNVSSVVSWIPFAKSMTDYANHVWSFGQIYLDKYVNDPNSIVSPICQFRENNVLIVSSKCGRYFEFVIQTEPSFSCKCVKTNNILSESFLGKRTLFSESLISFESFLNKELGQNDSQEEKDKSINRGSSKSILVEKPKKEVSSPKMRSPNFSPSIKSPIMESKVPQIIEKNLILFEQEEVEEKPLIEKKEVEISENNLNEDTLGLFKEAYNVSYHMTTEEELFSEKEEISNDNSGSDESDRDFVVSFDSDEENKENNSSLLFEATKNYVPMLIEDNRRKRTKSFGRKPRSRGHRAPGSLETSPLPSPVNKKFGNQFRLPSEHDIVLKPVLLRNSKHRNLKEEN